MMHNESGGTVKLARMTRLVDRARGAMNLLLITSAAVIWGSWDTAPTRFASLHYERVFRLLDETPDLTPAKDFGGLLLLDARKAANRALDDAKESWDKARESGDDERANELLDARIQLGRSSSRMDESRQQQLTVSAFESKPLEILGFHVHPASAGGLLSLAATGLLLYLISLTRTMRKYSIADSDWIFHLDGTLSVVLGGCWLLLPAAAVTMATGQLLWELFASDILPIDQSYLFLLGQLVVGILAPLLLGGLATWFAWKTRGNR